MRRILLLVTVALVMAAMMAFGAGAASAQVEFVRVPCETPSGKSLGSVIFTPGAFACIGRPL